MLSIRTHDLDVYGTPEDGDLPGSKTTGKDVKENGYKSETDPSGQEENAGTGKGIF